MTVTGAVFPQSSTSRWAQLIAGAICMVKLFALRPLHSREQTSRTAPTGDRHAAAE